MPDYINFHNRSMFTKRFILLIINFLALFPNTIFCAIWNLILMLINNSVRISKTKDGSLLVKDNLLSLEIVHKKRFEFYLQNISTRLKHISYEYMLDSIEIASDAVVIDCGANIGELYLAIKQNHQGNFNYFGFEPAPSEFKLLSKNTKNLVLKPVALSKNNKKRKFYIRSKSADSSFEKNLNHQELTVECNTIDQYFKEYKEITLLKLEAEGYELDVLLGATKSMKKIKYISADLGFELENNTKSSFESVNNLLTKNNFELLSSTKRLTYLYKNKKFT